MTEEEVVWILEEHPRTGYRVRGKGKGCPVKRKSIAEKLGPYGRKVFLDRCICEPAEQKEKKD